MDSKLDLNLLSVFLDVYRLRSITLAADALNMTQPGVSGALKRLQQQMGVELFVREGRGISPTSAAVQLASDISPAFEQMAKAMGNINQFTPLHHRKFNVLINEVVLQILQPLVERSELLGNCTIQFNPTPKNEENMLEMLSLQKADLAIDIGKVDGQSYASVPLLEESMKLICAKNHPRVQSTISKVQYYQEKHITLRVRRSNLYAADFFTTEILQERKISAECESVLSMMALVSDSDCIAMTSEKLAGKYAERFGLQVLSPPFETQKVVHQIVWHKRNQHSPANQWLRNTLMDLITTTT
ncbi:LysR family transcriptional regulator [Enterovibrio makurazakiensis]|uniref:LysR family transcriptional regulator n=1 Tax=Enterovibrio makurazakiensis TaxID=2910232 RepID=UPI003D21D99A